MQEKQMSKLDPASHKKGVLGFGSLEAMPQEELETNKSQPNEEAVLLALINARKAERTQGSYSNELYTLVAGYLGDDQATADSRPLATGNSPERVSQLESLILDVESKGGTVTFEEYIPTTNSDTTTQDPEGQSKNKLQELLKNHTKTKVAFGAVALIAGGLFFADNKLEDGLLAHMPLISTYFEKPAPPTQEELVGTAETLARKTSIEKPLFTEPFPISTSNESNTEPELSLPINYSTTSTDGQELTLANGVRMAAVNPYLQVNYSYNLQQLRKGLTYNPETQKVSVPTEALNLQFLLLAPPQSNQTINGKTPQFAYRIAGAVGENEAIIEEIKQQNNDFSAKDIKVFMDQLSNPANETAISMQITQDTFKQLLADPDFLKAINDRINQKIQDDIKVINPDLSAEPFQLTEEFVTSLNNSFSSSYKSTPLTGGLTLGSNISGLNPNQEIK
jgi:hypothetical protein